MGMIDEKGDLSDFLKLFKVVAVTTDAGRLFQILAAEVKSP